MIDGDGETPYERAPCGLLSCAPDGTILRVNATFLELTGYTREELLGRRRFVQLLSVGGRIYHETHYAPLLQVNGAAHEIALELRAADGRRLPVLVNSVLDRDEDQRPLVIRTAVFDASHRRLYEEELLRETRRAEASEARASSLARTLQQTLLPPDLPDIPGLEVGAEYQPSGDGSEVGGDFYDIFQTDDDDWVVVIGDVCGKGVQAAVVTAFARHTLRAAAIQHFSPALALSLLNAALLRSGMDRFCTAAVVRLSRDRGRWSLTSCAAGHPLPLLLRRGEGPRELGRSGTLLGAYPSLDLHEEVVPLDEGDVVLCFTDGVSEGRSPAGGYYGEDRFLDHLAGAQGSAAERAGGLLTDVLEFQQGTPRDDIALVVLRVPTGAPSGPG